MNPAPWKHYKFVFDFLWSSRVFLFIQLFLHFGIMCYFIKRFHGIICDGFQENLLARSPLSTHSTQPLKRWGDSESKEVRKSLQLVFGLCSLSNAMVLRLRGVADSPLCKSPKTTATDTSSTPKFSRKPVRKVWSWLVCPSTSAILPFRFSRPQPKKWKRSSYLRNNGALFAVCFNRQITCSSQEVLALGNLSCCDESLRCSQLRQHLWRLPQVGYVTDLMLIAVEV